MSVGYAYPNGITELRTFSGAADYDRMHVLESGEVIEYYWNSASTTADDGDGTIKPTAIAPGDPGRWIKANISSGTRVVIVQDVKSLGSSGGSSSAGMNTRTLNTVQYNGITGASLASNQLTLPAGTYHFTAAAVAMRAGLNKLLLYNVSDSAYSIAGLSCYSSAYSMGDGSTSAHSIATLEGILTISSSKVYQLRHYIASAYATIGLGAATSDGSTSERYATLVARKLA